MENCVPLDFLKGEEGYIEEGLNALGVLGGLEGWLIGSRVSGTHEVDEYHCLINRSYRREAIDMYLFGRCTSES